MTFLANRAFPYCKGCGHANVVRRLNEALMRLELDASQIVLTTDIGCVGLLDPLFPDVHTVHTIHGRSTAVAAGAVLADRLLGDGRMKNIVAIGDGGATIGQLHLSQAALMNVDLTVLLHNNMLYGMTGGQHSGLTPEGFATSTTPGGNWVPALDMEQFVRACQGPYFARKLATDPDLSDVIAEAIAFPGFAMVEILELCTGFAVPLNHLTGASLRAMAESQGHGLGVLVRRDDRRPYHQVYRERFPRDGAAGAVRAPGTGAVIAPDPRGPSTGSTPVSPASAASAPETEPSATPPSAGFTHRLDRPVGIIIAGSAGERVQTAAAILCQAAVLCGLHCVQKNDYPVTVGSGFSVSEVKLSPQPILYTGVDAPDAVLIVSHDGLKEVQGRGDLERLARNATVLIDASLPNERVPEAAFSVPLRANLPGDLTAAAAVGWFVSHEGLLSPGSLTAAIDALLLKDATTLKQALDAGRKLAANEAERPTA